MPKRWFFYFFIAAALLFGRYSFASVVINEVFFDPAGTDTGLEKIELYNTSDSQAAIGGWQLYPDGIGYYTFPSGFSIAGKSFVVVHLHSSGTDDNKNLYHPSATGNMGNSSGSVALFSGEPRGKDTIVDFMRYHKPGSSERKTWESAAAEAGLWTAGQFVDITNFQEGGSLALTSNGVRGSVSSWQVVSSSTLGAENNGPEESGGDGQESKEAPPPAGESVSIDSGRPVPPSLKAYAGDDRTVFQGAFVEFTGRASGINGEPLTSGRFFWNFGDGATGEGKIVSHVYYFPGVYNASLNVSSGEYSGSDYAKITVVRPDLAISEAKHGESGFIELHNNIAYRLDVGGFYLDDGAKRFVFERDTFMEPKAALVFPNAVTGLLLTPRRVSLRDAHGLVTDAGDFSSPLNIEESFERASSAESKFVRTRTPTPGAYAAFSFQAAEKGEAVSLNVVSPEAKAKNEISNGVGGAAKQEKTPFISNEAAEAAVVENVSGKSISSFWFLAASIAAAILAAGGFIIVKGRL